MGASSSSNNIRSTMSISTSEQETGACLYSEDVCSAQEQRAHLTTSEDQPRSQVHCSCQRNETLYDRPFIWDFGTQGPSPYATLRTGELWDQRPTASNLSNVLPPKRETLVRENVVSCSSLCSSYWVLRWIYLALFPSNDALFIEQALSIFWIVRSRIIVCPIRTWDRG